MKELPILFSTPMTEAIIDRRKSMTRRMSGLEEINQSPSEWYVCEPIVGHPEGIAFEFVNKHTSGTIRISPKYLPGNRLYVRETHYRFGRWIKNGFSEKTGEQKWRFVAATEEVLFNAPEKFYKSRVLHPHVECWYKRSSLFMPKSATRIWLRVTGVKVERARDISERDAEQEGIEVVGHNCYRNYMVDEDWTHFGKNMKNYHFLEDPIGSFHSLWAHINGFESLEANPWVFCYDFKVLSTKGKPAQPFAI